MGPRHRWDQLTLEPRTGEVQSEWINERLTRLDRLHEGEWFTMEGGLACTESANDRAFFSPVSTSALFGDVFPALSRRALGGRAERACRRRIVRHPARPRPGGAPSPRRQQHPPRGGRSRPTGALFPGQVTSGLAARSLVSGAQHLSFRALFAISLWAGRSAPSCCWQRR